MCVRGRSVRCQCVCQGAECTVSLCVRGRSVRCHCVSGGGVTDAVGCAVRRAGRAGRDCGDGPGATGAK